MKHYTFFLLTTILIPIHIFSMTHQPISEESIIDLNKEQLILLMKNIIIAHADLQQVLEKYKTYQGSIKNPR